LLKVFEAGTAEAEKVPVESPPDETGVAARPEESEN
jgi:hypothetical protein